MNICAIAMNTEIESLYQVQNKNAKEPVYMKDE